MITGGRAVKIRRFPLPLAALGALAFLLSRSPGSLLCAELAKTTIAARIVSVGSDGLTVVINRGKAENIIPGGTCVIHPNRGKNEADIEWDITFARGVVQAINDGNSVVRLTEVREKVEPRDYCVVDAEIPPSLWESDLGRIALYDICLKGLNNFYPLFTLAELIKDPSPQAMDAILGKLLADIHEAKIEYLVDEGIKTGKMKGGLFNGLGIEDVFQRTTREHIEKFVELVAWYPGRYINYDWTLIDAYANWAFTGTPSGEREKKSHRSEPAVLKGDDFLGEGKFPEALAEYRKALLVDAENDAAKKKTETLNLVLERRKTVVEDPKDVTARHALGLDLFSLRLYDEALVELQKAKELGDDSLELTRYLGYTLGALNRHAESRAILEPLAAKYPEDAGFRKWLDFITQNEIVDKQGPNVASFLTIGDLKYKEGNYDAAIVEYNKALDLAPKDRAVWARIANTAVRRKARREELWAKDYWETGEFDEARARWKTALSYCRYIKDTDGLKAILRDMGSRMYDSSFYADAIEAYKALLALDPDRADAHFEISRCCIETKDFASAVQWAERGLAKDPKDSWGFNLLGNIYEDMGKIDQAVANYQKAVELVPTYKEVWYSLGRLSAFKGEYEKAEESFRRALEIDSNYGEARSRLMDVEGILEANELLRTAPRSGEARFRLARALFNLGDYDRSIAALKDALKSPGDARWANEQLGHCLIKQGKYAEGKAALEEAFRLRPKPDLQAWAHYGEAHLLLEKNAGDPEAALMLGDDSLYWESFDDALSHYGKAKELGADAGVVSARMELARRGQEALKQLSQSGEYYRRSQFEQAAESAERALAIYKDLNALRGQVNALLWLGWSRAAMFRHDEALRAYREVGLIADAIGDEDLKASCLVGLGNYNFNLGEYEKALANYLEAGALWHRNNDFLNEAWSVLPAIGGIKFSLGDYNGELECYEKALAINRKFLYPWGEASNLLSYGEACQLDGDFSKAIDSYEKALAIAQKRNIKESALRAYSCLASIYMELGDVENAKKYFQYYLDSAQAQGAKSERANALNEFGLLYLEKVKDYGKAMSYFEESLSLARLTGYRALEGVATGNIASVYSRQGKYREAIPRHDEGLGIVRALKDKYLEMQGLNEEGESRVGLKEYDLALDCQLKARELAIFLGVRSKQWKYELAAGKTYEAKNDPAKAIESYKNAAETLKGIKNRIANEKLLKDFSEQEKQTDVYKRLIALLLKSSRTEEAFRFIEESKSKIVKDAFGDIKPAAEDPALNQTLQAVDTMERKKEALAGELQKEKQKPAEAQDAKKLEILTKTLATTAGEFNQCMLKLKFQNRKIYDALSIKPAELADVQSQIPAGAVFLEYFISPDQLYILCIGKGLFRAETAVISEADLTTLVNRFVRLCQEPPSGGTDKVMELGRQLYKDLIAPVEDIFEKSDTVVIVPFGVLYYLPFQALVRQTDGKAEYLIERKRICYTSSASFADILKNESRGNRSLMAFGDPDGTLPAAAEEVRSLREKIFKADATVLVSKDATKAAFLNRAKDFNLLHLATHGVIEANPLDSYLLFAGASKESQELTLNEVAGYAALREKNSLVFLSACQTAKEAGKAGTGSELITLAEAFAMAGAPTLIATLWQVEENSTRQLALAFYDELINKKKDKLDSLRAAQIALIRSAEYSHPFFWAPFIMIGSWR
jgi:tetratricopeptide (TPR) repeat protein